MSNELIENPLLLEVDFFTHAECEELIQRANNIGWHRANTGGEYFRAIMIDKQLAEQIWLKVKHLLPETITICDNTFTPVYVNDHFRFSRYEKGGEFTTHLDGYNFDSNNNHSMFTINIFLNDKNSGLIKGGGTTFYKNNMEYNKTIHAKAGTGALFYAKQYHSGDVVEEGYKYLLRTDVMVS